MNDHSTDANAKEDPHRSAGRARSHVNRRSPFFAEDVFTILLARERRRAERSRQRFAVLLLDVRHAVGAHPRDPALGGLPVALAAATRETDIWGWYKEDARIGVILTELRAADHQVLQDRVLARVRAALHTHLGPALCATTRLSFHMFPATSAPRNGHGNSEDTRWRPEECGKSAA